MLIVTGGAGFIGSNLIRGLNDMGIDDIIVVDNLKNGVKHRNLNTLRFKDFVDKETFINNLDMFKSYRIDTIFHQGACTNTLENDGSYMMANNYDYSKKLLEFATQTNSSFIYASSASVYGDGANGFVEERRCEYPLNVYAFSKFLFDQYIRGLLHAVGIQIVGLRYFNVYGPQEAHKGKMASVVYHFHNQILDDGTIKLFEGSRGFKRDFIHVDDVVKVNLFFFKNRNRRGIFNCGTGTARSFYDIAAIMEKLYKSVRIEFVRFPEELKGKYQAFTKADLSRLREAGYEGGFIPLEKGVTDYVEILKKTGGFYR